jgi:hypothetical protein
MSDLCWSLLLPDGSVLAGVSLWRLQQGQNLSPLQISVPNLHRSFKLRRVRRVIDKERGGVLSV